jgi:UDPglucose--hexose-1-phosphate uridylyltransferase
MGAEYRVDPETGDWNIISPERAVRPTDQSATPNASCPFCPGNEDMTPPEVLRVPAAPATPWRVRVVPNRYGIVSPPDPSPAATVAQSWAAIGMHEVVVESPYHDGDLRFAGADDAAEVLRVIRERCRAMAARRPAAIVVFRNHGAAAGTSLHHPHSQIISLDQAPPGLERRWQRAGRYFLQTGRCLQDDLAAAERADAVRVVEDTDEMLVYQPRAAAFSHQTVLLPRDTSTDLAGASDEALAAVARTLPRVVAGLAAVCGDPAYNLVVHAGPTGRDEAERWYRWYIGLYPRVSRRAGLEIATGLNVNPTVPERTAPVLRQAMADRR